MATTDARLIGPSNFYAGELYIREQKFQNFIIGIVNDGGTLKHFICDTSWNYAAAYADKVVGASLVWTATPSLGPGVDFAAGVGIQGLSSTADGIIFNTAAQDVTKFAVLAAVVYNDTGAACWADASTNTSNVNGVTRERAMIHMSDVSGSLNLTTVSIPSGKYIAINVLGFFA